MQFSSTFMRNIAYGILGLLAIVIMVSSFTIKNNIINSVFGVSNVKAFNDNKNNYATFGSVKEGFLDFDTSKSEYETDYNSGNYKKSACEFIKNYYNIAEPSRKFNADECEKKPNDIINRLREIKNVLDETKREYIQKLLQGVMKNKNKNNNSDDMYNVERQILKGDLEIIERYEKYIHEYIKKIK